MNETVFFFKLSAQFHETQREKGPVIPKIPPDQNVEEPIETLAVASVTIISGSNSNIYCTKVAVVGVEYHQTSVSNPRKSPETA